MNEEEQKPDKPKGTDNKTTQTAQETAPTSGQSGANTTEVVTLASFSDEDKQTLLERADRLAKEETRLQVAEGDREAYVCFRLGETEQYGISYRFTDEIIHVNDIARVPCTPAFIAGITNRRGELLPILDIKEFFHTGQTELSDVSRIVVVSDGNITVGILVDEVIGNDEYKSSELSKALPSDGVTDLKYIQGIHRGRVTMLDIGVLLTDEGITVNESVG